jgi:hypothetical protein
VKIRPLFIAFICATGLLFSATLAVAAPKDAKATKLYDQALDEDYLNTAFDAAIAKLKKAIKLCGKSGCSAKLLGKLHVGLGTVYGGGKGDKARAKQAFADAFNADKNAQPLDDFMTEDLKTLFKEAKSQRGTASGGDKGGDKGGESTSSAAGDIDYIPPSEALVNTPMPVFITVPADVGAEQVKLRYKPFGGVKWLSVKLKPLGEGFGAMIPCAQITTTGKLRLYIIIKDSEGDPIATAGTLKHPHIVQIKNKIEDEQPALPGLDPPKKCQVKADCPPGFPGCGEAATKGDKGDKSGSNKQRGSKGWGATCEETKECQSGFVCQNGSCEMGEDDSDGDGDGDSGGGSDDGEPKNYLSLGLQLDILGLSSAEQVCGYMKDNGNWTTEHDNYRCFSENGEFIGRPEKNRGNQVIGGGALAGARLLVGYDRVLYKGFVGGARIGYAFGGYPAVGDDSQERFDEHCKDANGEGKHSCREPGNNFLPFHGEIRASYFLPKMFDDLFRPYAFVGGGLGAVSAGVELDLCDRMRGSGEDFDDSQECKIDKTTVKGAKERHIEAYQITGLNFIDFGGGAIFNIDKNWGVNVEAKFMIMLPTTGFVFSPSVAPVFMF